jgi:enoyl-CoA hydratase/carnithine racemase
VLPDAIALAAHARQLAAQIAEKSPLAMAGSKQALN